jgi:hypothetical protein
MVVFSMTLAGGNNILASWEHTGCAGYFTSIALMKIDDNDKFVYFLKLKEKYPRIMSYWQKY